MPVLLDPRQFPTFPCQTITTLHAYPCETGYPSPGQPHYGPQNSWMEQIQHTSVEKDYGTGIFILLKSLCGLCRPFPCFSVPTSSPSPPIQWGHQIAPIPQNTPGDSFHRHKALVMHSHHSKGPQALKICLLFISPNDIILPTLPLPTCTPSPPRWGNLAVGTVYFGKLRAFRRA